MPITHAHVSAVTDDPSKDVSSGEWNADHVGSSDAITDPTDIADCALWLDASQEVGFADDDLIPGMTDLSGNGADVACESGDAIWALTTNGAISGTITFAADDGTNPPVTVGPLAFDADGATLVAAFTTAGVTGVTLLTVGPLTLADELDVAFTGLWSHLPVNITISDDSTVGGSPSVFNSVAGHGPLGEAPTYKTNIVNGLPVIHFTPGLQPPQHFLVPNAVVDGLTEFTFAVVLANFVQTATVLGMSDDGGTVWWEWEGSGHTGLNVRDALVLDATTLNSVVSVGVGIVACDLTACNVAMDYGPATFELTNPEVPQDPLASVSVSIGLIGAEAETLGGDMGADLCELVVYGRALNARERRQLAEYLSAKWGTL